MNLLKKIFHIIKGIIGMLIEKTTLLQILTEFLALKEQVIELEASVASLTTQLAEAEAELVQYAEYKGLLDDPEIIAAYEAAKEALTPTP